MKFLIASLLLLPLSGITQVTDTLFEKQMKELNYLIQSNMPSKEDEYVSKSSEYFIFDLTLDSTGDLITVDILCRDNSLNISLMKKIKPIIKKNWTKINSGYYKIFIPVIITFFYEDQSEANNIIGTLAFNEMLRYIIINDKRIFLAKRISYYWSPNRH